MGESNWRDTLARCPFYEQSSIATRAGRISKITCDWIPEGDESPAPIPGHGGHGDTLADLLLRRLRKV